MEFILDFTDVKLGGAPTLPPGVYRFKVDTSKSVFAKSQSGGDKLPVTFIVQSPPEFAGRALTENFSMADNVRWRIGAFLQAIGVINSEGPVGEIRVNTKKWHNAVCDGTVRHETYNGKTYARIAQFHNIKAEQATADKSTKF